MIGSSLPYVASRLFNTPLAVHPGKAAAILHALGTRALGVEEIEIIGAEPIDHVAFAGGTPSMGRLGDPLGRSYQAENRQAFDRIGSVAIIPIEGSLIHKGKWVGAFSGDTSYEGIQTRVRQVRADKTVRGVIFEIDSFGGEVAGAFDTAALIRKLSAEKPTMAILSDFALSAGYLLASGARQIVMPESGRAGAIGVITMHADYSQAMKTRGVKVTVLSAGKHKAEGNPYEALPEDVAERWRADLEAARGLFADAVAEGRGKRLTKEAALATEADDFRGADAVELGLVDATDHSNAAFDAFVAEIEAASRPQTGGYIMTNAALAAAQAAAQEAKLIDSATHEAAVTVAKAEGKAEGHITGLAAGKIEGAKEAASAERSRIKAILDHESAKGREDLARYFAFDTDMAPEGAQAALSKAPKQAAADEDQKEKSLFDEMRDEKKPNVSANGGKAPESLSDYDKGASWMASILGKQVRS
jgi:signal peptide peptidase SppA